MLSSKEGLKNVRGAKLCSIFIPKFVQVADLSTNSAIRITNPRKQWN